MDKAPCRALHLTGVSLSGAGPQDDENGIFLDEYLLSVSQCVFNRLIHRDGDGDYDGCGGGTFLVKTAKNRPARSPDTMIAI